MGELLLLAHAIGQVEATPAKLHNPCALVFVGQRGAVKAAGSGYAQWADDDAGYAGCVADIKAKLARGGTVKSIIRHWSRIEPDVYEGAVYRAWDTLTRRQSAWYTGSLLHLQEATAMAKTPAPVPSIDELIGKPMDRTNLRSLITTRRAIWAEMKEAEKVFASLKEQLKVADDNIATVLDKYKLQKVKFTLPELGWTVSKWVGCNVTIPASNLLTWGMTPADIESVSNRSEYTQIAVRTGEEEEQVERIVEGKGKGKGSGSGKGKGGR